MSAFGFSDNKKVNMESLKVPKELSVLQTIDKNNFSNMKLLKSIYDDSFDVANDFFKEGFKSKSKKESDKKKADAKKAAEKAKQSARDVEEAKRKVDEAKKESDKKVEEAKKDVEDAKEDAKEAKEEANEAKEEANDAEEIAAVEGDDLIEGMKSKKSKSKKSAKSKGSKGKNSFDIIAWAVNKAKGTINDEQIIKSVLNTLFVTFLSFLIAHNWYSNFLTNQSYFRIENILKSENTFIQYFTEYIVNIVITIETFLMCKIPGYLNTLKDTQIFGKRSVFYIILMASLSFVPYFLAQLMAMYEYLKAQAIKLFFVIQNYNKSPVGLRNYIRDLISNFFSFIFLFKGNPFISGIIGFLFFVEFVKSLISQYEFIIQKPILLGIYNVFKFAIFYQPTVAFSSLILTAYFLYFSVFRLPIINGIGGIFREMFKNAEDMNKEKIKFSFSESIEKIINFIVDNFHQIVLLFILKQNFPIILNMDSVIAKFIFIALVVIGVLKLLYSILEKKGIGIEEKRVLESNIEIVSKELERSITESNAKPPSITLQDDFMLKNLYQLYK
jgi:hypothetical protein